MSQPSGTSSHAAPGNVGVPEWMLKRRARQQELAEREAANSQAASETGILGGQTSTNLPVVTPESVQRPAAETPARSEIPSKPVSTPSAPPAIESHVNSAAALDEGDQFEGNPLFQFDKKPAPVSEPEIVIALPEPNVTGKKKPARKVQLPGIKTESDQPPMPLEESFRERWFSRQAIRGYCISLCTHITLAVLLSLVVFHQDLSNSGISTLLASSGDGTEELLDSTLISQDLSGGQSNETLDTMLRTTSVSSTLGPTTLNVPESIGGTATGEGDGEGEAVGSGLSVGGYQMPAAGKYVKKGSFTAWTVPADPAPGEDYKIVIQVEYKKKGQKLTTGDISGSVIGTDKFRLMISPHTTELIPEANQVVVYIPGAAARVRDTIRVYSTILKENQRLEIVF